MTAHTSHLDVLIRLKRTQGHLKSFLSMLEEGRGCLEIAQPLQAVEKAIGSAKKTLVHDHTLLGEKGELDRVIFEGVCAQAATYGLMVESVGVKDVILPGDMKDILNQVVQAEKAAQANIIKRREETAATRAALNTAKLMQESPLLLRLKELEVLEKIAEKVDKLTVFGGLDGVLCDMVKINV